MSEEHYAGLGVVLESCHAQALKNWRDEYAPAIATDDLLGYHVREVRIASNVLPKGHVDVMVRVVPRARWQTEIYFWKFFRVAGVYQAF